MRFSTCRTCGRHIDAEARVCPICGALTGVSKPAQDEQVSLLSFIAAVVVGFFGFLILKWLGVLL
ncbi:hypothetical protein ACRAWG_21030 [Methylobacterium sp. P31]